MTPCPNFIASEWRAPANVAATPVYNPSRGEVITETPLCGAEAAATASAAFFGWADTPPTECARVFFRLDLDAAIELANASAYGNGASIFTRSRRAAREFKQRVKAGMVGINIGVPASMAWFFTQLKITTSRWFSHGEGSI